MPWDWLRDRHVSERELVDRGIGAIGKFRRDDPLWPGQLATLAALALYLLLPSALTIGPRWPLPLVEGLVLAALVIATRAGRDAGRRRGVAIALVLVAAIANLVALGLLVHYLLAGGHARGATLLDGGVIIWVTSLLLFAVLYWEIDRGGPRPVGDDPRPVLPDCLFPQMSDERYAPPGWHPRFADYLYMSLTNQTAFSPTDTMPLTRRLKALMGLQGTAALVTIGIIIARAVNVLG
jgi:uncharacterized membrane protein